MGLERNATVQYGDEKAAMWNGERDFAVEGNWSSGGFYASDVQTPVDDHYAFRSAPFNASVGNDGKYLMAGFFHGWMISKNCFNNETKLKNAVAFIKAQVDNIAEFGAPTSNGVSPSSDKTIVQQTLDIVKLQDEGYQLLAPLDDRLPQAVKDALMGDGLQVLLQGGSISANTIIKNVMDAFDR
ncbi:MAG: hypothetical protein FWD76_03925, partial [Firmicutes bacterium]|nr:hypothetical protein [Bacillota bacterium]